MSRDIPASTADKLDRSYIGPRNQAILDMLHKGLPVSHVANHFGISPFTVRNIASLARNGKPYYGKYWAK